MDGWSLGVHGHLRTNPEELSLNHFIASSPLEYSISLSLLLRRSGERRRRSKEMDADGSEGHVCRLGSSTEPLVLQSRTARAGPPEGSRLTAEGCDSYATARCRAMLHECEALSHRGGPVGHSLTARCPVTACQYPARLRGPFVNPRWFLRINTLD